MKFTSLLKCALMISGMPVISAVAHAQDVQTGEILVTALKRAESSLKVPATISVLGGGDLRTLGVGQLTDVQNVVPSVTINNGRDGATVAIRGVTTTDTSSKGQQDIAFNIDGVYVGRGNARGAAFFDVERIEVLRGPQGTLYGRSSTGGAINVITVAPKLGQFSAFIRAEVGNFGAKRGEGAINIPVSDTLALRFSGAFNKRDGYSKPINYSPTGASKNGGTTTVNIASEQGFARNDQDDQTGRASLFFKPSEDFNLRLTATVGRQGGAGNAPALQTQLTAANDTGAAALQILANPIRPFLRNNFQNYDARLIWNFASNTQLDLMGSYQWMHFTQRGTTVQDVNANNNQGAFQVFRTNPGPGQQAWSFYYQDNRVITKQAEARISNINPAKLEYVLGLNWFNESAGESGQSWAAMIDNPYDESKYAFQSGPVNVTTHKSWGAFGQGTYHVDDRLSLVAGVRFTHNAIDRKGRFSIPFNFGAGGTPWPDAAGNAICTYPNPCLGGKVEGGASDNKVTYRIGANFQINPTNLLFASVATGFKGGTFNDYDPSTGGPGQVGSSNVTAYELGYKGRPLKGLTLTSSLYYYDFSKYQVTSGVTFPAGNFVIFTISAPVKMKGWENEFTYQLGAKTTLNGSFALLDSKFSRFNAGQYAFAGYPISFTGQSLDLAPQFTAAAYLNHTFDLSADSSLRLRVGGKYSDGYLLSNFGQGIRYRQKAFTRSDTSITYEREGGRYSLQLFVENIENKVQRTSTIAGYNGGYGGVGGSTSTPITTVGNGQMGAQPANYVAFYTTTPRFFGLRGTMKF